MSKFVEFTAYGWDNKLMAAKIVQVPSGTTQQALNTLTDIFEEDLLCRFFTNEDDFINTVVTCEMAGEQSPDYEASIDEAGEWDLRPL
jgi:hypothetical protein